MSDISTTGKMPTLAVMASIVGLYIAVPLILIVPMSFNTSTSVEFPPTG